MKKALSTYLLVISVFFLNISDVCSQGVASLKVLSMPGFPDLPSDTAYEGQSYTFTLNVFNNTNVLVNSTLEIQLKVDSVETTIFANPAAAIQPGDTAIITVTGYNFTQPQYKAGNNIVVVWPRVSGQVIPVDTFFTDVFFVPLNSLGDGYFEANDINFNVFPVPSNDFISIPAFDQKSFEYVRIYSVTGKLIHEEKSPSGNRFFIGALSPGIYLFEAGYEGQRLYSKFIRQ